MVLFSLFKHANTRRNGQMKKIMGNFSENIRNKWTGFIRQRIKPVHLVFIFFLIFLFSQMFAFCQQREFYHQNQRTKLLILRSYVDLLNYPFNTGDQAGAKMPQIQYLQVNICYWVWFPRRLFGSRGQITDWISLFGRFTRKVHGPVDTVVSALCSFTDTSPT